MRHGLSVGPVNFASKREAQDFVKDILNTATLDQDLPKREHIFLADLLNLHPLAKTKIGCGVAAFQVRQNPLYPTRTFYLIRIDGTSTDFSYRECLTPSTQRDKVMAAMRAAVSEQVIAFKHASFLTCESRVRCAVSDHLILSKDADVDHQPPATFEVLVDEFLSRELLKYDQVTLRGELEDNSVQTRLADAELERRWCEYHQQHCELRIVQKSINRGASRRRGD